MKRIHCSAVTCVYNVGRESCSVENVDSVVAWIDVNKFGFCTDFTPNEEED